MKACVINQGSMYRVVNCGSNQPIMNEQGAAVDGGGHETRFAAEEQANVLNIIEENSRGVEPAMKMGESRTTVNDGHSHTYEAGDARTSFNNGHSHAIENGRIQEANGHTHSKG